MTSADKTLLKRAVTQLCTDYSCNPADFSAERNIVTLHSRASGQRAFPADADFFKAATFGKNTVVSVREEFLSEAKKLCGSDRNLFDGRGISSLGLMLYGKGFTIESIKEYYTPGEEFARFPSEGFRIRLLEESEIKKLIYPYPVRFENAFLYFPEGRRRDKLAVCALNGREIIGAAGASEDSDFFFQIGIDILPRFRGLGLAKILVSTLADEILKRGNVPYYGTWPGNIPSKKTALSSGFVPAWTEIVSGKCDK